MSQKLSILNNFGIQTPCSGVSFGRLLLHFEGLWRILIWVICYDLGGFTEGISELSGLNSRDIFPKFLAPQWQNCTWDAEMLWRCKNGTTSSITCQVWWGSDFVCCCGWKFMGRYSRPCCLFAVAWQCLHSQVMNETDPICVGQVNNLY